MFVNRPVSTLAEWCSKHYPQFSAIELQHVKFVAHMFAQEIGVDVTQLDPKDKILDHYCLKGVCSIFDYTWQAWTEKVSDYVKTVRGRAVTRIEGHISCNWITLDNVIRGVVEMLQAGEFASIVRLEPENEPTGEPTKSPVE